MYYVFVLFFLLPTTVLILHERAHGFLAASTFLSSFLTCASLSPRVQISRLALPSTE
jgi:hypothetical protein